MWEEYRIGSPPALLCVCSESSWPTGKAGRSPTEATSPTEAAVLIVFLNHGDQPPEILDLKVGLSRRPLGPSVSRWYRLSVQEHQLPSRNLPEA